MEGRQALVTRRLGLIRGSHLLMGVAALVLAGKPGTAAAAKADKKDFFYRDKPNDGKSCSTCRLYSMTSSGQGTCAIVEGNVSATGWCAAYSPRG